MDAETKSRFESLEKKFDAFVLEMQEFKADMLEFRDFVIKQVALKSDLEHYATKRELKEEIGRLYTIQDRLDKERIITDYRLSRLEKQQA